MRILVFKGFSNELREQLQAAFPLHELLFKQSLTPDSLQTAFNTADIFLGNAPLELFQQQPANLKFWQLESAGFDQYKNLGLQVPVANMGDFFALKCAETAVAGLLALYRGMNTLLRLQDKKEWQSREVRTHLQLLSYKTVLILGLGTIGKAVQKVLTGFGCQIITSARQNPQANLHSINDVLTSLPGVDVVINTLPGAAKNYVSAQFLESMKPGSAYVSVGRGSTTDEAALITALKTGKLAGAVLDVTAIEPLPLESELWEMNNVILSQHSGGGSADEHPGILNMFISNAQRFLSGQQPDNLVDLNRGY